MKKIISILIIIFLIIGITEKIYAEEKVLEKIEDSIWKPKDNTGKNEKKPPEKQEDHGYGKIDMSKETEKTLDELLVFGIFIAATSPFSVPYILLEDNYHKNSCYWEYPCKDGNDINLRAAYAYLTAKNDITANRYLIELNYLRLGLDYDYYKFYEVLDNNEKDKMNLASSNLYFHFAHNDNINFKFGLGVKSIERSRIKRGLNVSYKAEAFLKKQVHFNLDFEYSRLGSADVFKLYSSIGLVYKRFEISGGYNFNKFEDQNIEGLEIKTTIWF